LARIFPASNTGQRIVGPMDQKRLAPENQSLALMLCKPKAPRSENFGIEIGCRRAHVRRGGGELALRPPDVGPAAQEVRRQTDARPGRQCRDRRLLRDLIGERAGLRAQQHIEPVHRLFQAALEQRNLRRRRAHLAVRLCDFQVAGETRIESDLREAQRLLLRRQIRPGDGQPPLKASQIDIIFRHVAEQRDQHGAPVLDAGAEVRFRRFNAPARAAEDVDLPAGVETGAKEVLFQLAAAERRGDGALPGRTYGVRARAVASIGARDIDRGPEIGAGRAHRRARLADARLGDAQIQVGFDGIKDQGIQRRILKLIPPFDQLSRLGADAFLLCLLPSRRHGERRLAVVGPDAAAGGK
jgi:hypothetical protein